MTVTVKENVDPSHFYVIVHGSVEVRKTTADGYKRLAALRAGQAFGEMALLNQTPRLSAAQMRAGGPESSARLRLGMRAWRNW